MARIYNAGDKDVITTTYGCDADDRGPHRDGKIMIKGLKRKYGGTIGTVHGSLGSEQQRI